MLTPNPSQTQATLSFSLSVRDRVGITVRNLEGELIGVYHDAVLDAGEQRVTLHHVLAPGAYVVELDVDGRSRSMIMVVVR